jgi:hypothetical protein
MKLMDVFGLALYFGILTGKINSKISCDRYRKDQTNATDQCPNNFFGYYLVIYDFRKWSGIIDKK